MQVMSSGMPFSEVYLSELINNGLTSTTGAALVAECLQEVADRQNSHASGATAH